MPTPTVSHTPYLDTLDVEPAQPATASVIWMHGLGADANDFYSVPSQLGLPADLHVRYVFPNAPRIPVTINMGMIMRAWYDVSSLDARSQDEERIRTSARWIGELVTREAARGVPANRVVLAGFSQGGAMALFTGLRYREALAGIICLSAYHPLRETLAGEAGEASLSVSIFQAHGTQDPVVAYELGRGDYEMLTHAGYKAAWHEYPMAHQVCGEELRDVGTWLAKVLDPATRRGGS